MRKRQRLLDASRVRLARCQDHLSQAETNYQRSAHALDNARAAIPPDPAWFIDAQTEHTNDARQLAAAAAAMVAAVNDYTLRAWTERTHYRIQDELRRT